MNIWMQVMTDKLWCIPNISFFAICSSTILILLHLPFSLALYNTKDDKIRLHSLEFSSVTFALHTENNVQVNSCLMMSSLFLQENLQVQRSQASGYLSLLADSHVHVHMYFCRRFREWVMLDTALNLKSYIQQTGRFFFLHPPPHIFFFLIVF